MDVNLTPTLAANPKIGYTREDLTDQPVRFRPMGSCLIVFNPEARPLAIVRPVHGARDVTSRLE
jgi:plasmid stabilization system protein ParE